MGLLDKFKKKKDMPKDAFTEPKPADSSEAETEVSVLIHSCSPCCPMEAFVEQDERTCYFYLWRHPNTPQAVMSSCFVCNTADRTYEVPIEVWRQNPSGPPMIPYEQVVHNTDGLKLNEEELEIVWTMEASGAGLLWKGELIAFIPEWAANENFSGYSRYIKGETPFGWEMTQAKEHLEAVVQAGREFWEKMESDYWPDFQKSHLNSIEEYIGGCNQYYAIDGGEFPPKALVTGEKEGILYGITLGVSLLRQPMVESFYQEQTPDFSRIELGFACRKDREGEFMPILQRMASAASLPWRQITSLGHGHTLRLEGIEGFPAAWLLNANLLTPGASPSYQDAFGERVNLLWLVPLTQTEYDFLLEYDMQRIFDLRFPKEMIIFDGSPKVPLEQLKELPARSSAERNEIGNEALKENLAAKALELLKEGEEYDPQADYACEFGYLFEIEGHGLEALFKITTNRGVSYFAAQKNSLLRLNFNEELFRSTTDTFLSLHQ